VRVVRAGCRVAIAPLPSALSSPVLSKMRSSTWTAAPWSPLDDRRKYLGRREVPVAYELADNVDGDVALEQRGHEERPQRVQSGRWEAEPPKVRWKTW
jgi:hypothetical protein